MPAARARHQPDPSSVSTDVLIAASNRSRGVATAARPRPAGRRRGATRPQRLAAGAGAAVLVVVVTLSLSDAVPGYYKRLVPHLPPALRASPLLSFSSVWGLHFVAFAVLSFLAFHAVSTWRAKMGALAALMACGWAIELGQALFSTIRAYQDVDLAADANGILLGFTAAVCLVTLRSQIGGRPARIGLSAAKNSPS